MEKFDSELEKTVFERFKEALVHSDLEIKVQDRWQTPVLLQRFDIVIYKRTNPLAVIEVNSSIQHTNILARAIDQVRSALSITNARYGIVTDICF
jgi:hypothetical protein